MLAFSLSKDIRGRRSGPLLRWMILLCVLAVALTLLVISFPYILAYAGARDCSYWQDIPMTTSELTTERFEQKALLQQLIASQKKYVSIDVGDTNPGLRAYSGRWRNLYSRPVLRVTVAANKAIVTVGTRESPIYGYPPSDSYSLTWGRIFARNHARAASDVCARISYVDSSGIPVTDESGKAHAACCASGL
jgi:hypothetical protein